MCNKDFDGALQDAENLVKMVEGMGVGDGPPDLKGKAANMIAFAEFVVHQYGWALDPNQAYRFNNLVEETRSALEKGDMAALEQRVAALEQVMNTLPDAIQTFITVRMAIFMQIRPADPVAASNLLKKLDDVEAAFKANSPDAGQKFVNLAEELQKVITHLPTPVHKQCSNGHMVPPGERCCPVCQEDTWLLGSKSSGAMSGEYRPKR